MITNDLILTHRNVSKEEKNNNDQCSANNKHLISVLNFISSQIKQMETILEQQRRYHEERERLIKLMVDEYVTKKPSVSLVYYIQVRFT